MTLWRFFEDEPPHVGEEEATIRVVRVAIRVSEFVMDAVQSVDANYVKIGDLLSFK